MHKINCNDASCKRRGERKKLKYLLSQLHFSLHPAPPALLLRDCDLFFNFSLLPELVCPGLPGNERRVHHSSLFINVQQQSEFKRGVMCASVHVRGGLVCCVFVVAKFYFLLVASLHLEHLSQFAQRSGVHLLFNKSRSRYRYTHRDHSPPAMHHHQLLTIGNQFS